MRTFLAHDRLQLLFVVLGVATCTWRGLAAAAAIAGVIACRRLIRRRLPVWFPDASTTPDRPGAAAPVSDLRAQPTP